QVELDFRLVLLPEPLVERLQALVITRCLAHVDTLAGEVVERFELGRFGAGDNEFADRPSTFVAGNEVDLLEPLVRNRQIAEGDVAQAVFDKGKQLVARGRGDIDRERYLPQLLPVFDIEIALPVPRQLDRDAPLAPLVAEIKRAGKRRVDAN